MKYHAIITIVDDKNNEITRIAKDEIGQYNLPENNVVVHEFHIGVLSIAEEGGAK